MKETQIKLTLTPVDMSRARLIEPKPPHTRIQMSSGQMHIGKRADEQVCMDGLFFRLFFDQTKNVIAWQVKQEITELQKEDKVWKLAKKNESGNISISIGRILDALNIPREGSKTFEIKKWNSNRDSMIDDGGHYFYIELSNPVGEEKTV